ncbi:MAG: choice-of-anchor M domain-containing protein [Chthoniobacteraceae bacterium]
MKRLALLFAAARALGYTVVVPDAQALTHSDVAITFASGKLEGRVRADAFGTTPLPPGDTLLYDGPAGTTTINRPADSFWDFIGVGAGESLYYWPQSQLAQRLYLGFASDGGLVPAGTFASYFEGDPRVGGTARWIKIALTDVQFTPAAGEMRPGHFSLWQTGGSSGTTVWMSSLAGGVDASDATWLIEGGHGHFNWGFAARGYYRLTFQFSGTLAANGLSVSSAPITYHFGVEHQPLALVPEPAAPVLLALGALFCGLRRPTSTSRTETKPTHHT